MSFGHDPDDALREICIWPEVVRHGPKLWSTNNWRTHCLKNCGAPADVRISMNLRLSPKDHDEDHDKQALQRYSSTTTANEGLQIEVTTTSASWLRNMLEATFLSGTYHSHQNMLT